MTYRITILGLVSLALSGCGGGSTSTPAPDASPFLEITTANSTQAAQSSYKVAMASSRSGDLPVAPGPTAATTGGVAKTAVDVFLKTGSGHRLLSDPFGPVTARCAVGGSITISGDVTDPLTLTMGDEFLFQANSCDDDTGEIIDGDFAFVVNAFEGDFETGMYLLTITVTTTNFQVTTADDVVSSTGDATVTIDTRQLPLVAVSVSGDSLRIDTNSSTATLSGYATTQTLDTGVTPPPYTFASSGTLVTTELTGTVSYSTPKTFTGVGADYPSKGELHVMGEKSAARLIALDNVNVQIDTDADGDGDYESSVIMTWEEFTG